MTHQLISVGAVASGPIARTPKALPAGRLKAARSKGLQPSTIAAYEADVERFLRAGGAIPCDGNSLKRLLSKLRNTHSPNTLYRLCMAVQFGHERRGYVSPTRETSVRIWLRALQRGIVPPKDPATDIWGMRAKQKKPKSVLPLTYRMLELILDLLPKSSVERRNHALLLVGWHTGLSRTTLVAVDICDLRFGTDSLVLTIKSGKDTSADTLLLAEKDAAPLRRITLPLTNGPI